MLPPERALGSWTEFLPRVISVHTIPEPIPGISASVVMFCSLTRTGFPISGADFAQAFVDEIETPTHTGQRFTVAY